MPLAQLQACLAAVDRRDAALALIAMQGVHAAHAPLAVGKEGSSVFDKFVAAMKRVISPSRTRLNEDDHEIKTFQFLMAKAKADQLAAAKANLNLKPTVSHG